MWLKKSILASAKLFNKFNAKALRRKDADKSGKDSEDGIRGFAVF
jgi:hypothetical protein